MANQTLFATRPGAALPRSDVQNLAGGAAYRYAPAHRLAQLALTGSLNDTFYADAQTQLDDVLLVADEIDAQVLARTAVYARQHGHMKDMPATLLAVLSRRDPELFTQVFDRVIDNGRLLRTFVQIMRSGATGRSSLGSAPKRCVARWLVEASDQRLIRSLVGRSPSVADVIRIVHPRPASAKREALFGWIIGHDVDRSMLPKDVRRYLAFVAGESTRVPDVPFQMLTALPLTSEMWSTLALRGGWQMVRMNLATFERHGVFQRADMTGKIATRLVDAQAIRRARVMPYQLLAAARGTEGRVPVEVQNALVDAMEISVTNTPAIAGRVAICPDVSGSMMMPVTGYRGSATSSVRCIDVAGLFSAALLRRNATAEVLPFDVDVHEIRLRSRDSVMSNAEHLAAFRGGATNCAAPLRYLNQRRAIVDLVVMVSDNQSWIGASGASSARRGTAVMCEWSRLKRRCPKARLVCIDLAPYGSTQAAPQADILNIGGFSDAVFDLVATFARGESGAGHWARQIARVAI